MEKHNEDSKLLQEANVRGYFEYKQALSKKIENETSSGNKYMLFAREFPQVDHEHMRIKSTRQYLVGGGMSFYKYAHSVTGRVMLEEVIEESKITPLYFDIEIKQDANIFNHLLLGMVFKTTASKMCGLEVNPVDVTHFVDAYIWETREPLTEKTCAAGLTVMLDHINVLLRQWNLLPKNSSLAKVKVLTGCRQNKFSIHVIYKDLYCDAPITSMPLLVFEIARRSLHRTYDG
eukprot:scaffold10969_cov36-Attheya_sp.AAC.3